MKEPYIYLSLIVPRLESPGKNLDVYLRPLIDELKSLWNDGTLTYDASLKENYTMKATVRWMTSNFPAYNMLSGWSTHGPKACPHCMGDSNTFMLKHGRKPSWFDCHQRHLPPSHHPFRKNRVNFKKGRVEKDLPPLRLSGSNIYN